MEVGSIGEAGDTGPGHPRSGDRGLLPVRLVVTDLDGTVLRPNGRVSARTTRALDLVRRSGVPVLFASGRPIRWMHDIARDTGYHELAICSNGALLSDLASGAAIEERLLDVSLGKHLIDEISGGFDAASFGVELGDTFRCDPGYHYPEAEVDAVRVVPADELFEQPAYKLLVQGRGFSVDELWRKVAPMVGDAAEVTHSGGSNLLEISAPGVGKASMLERYCAARGIRAADVVAFGDMPNDLAMLDWAGLSYAMGNAHPDVLAAADRQCPSNERDGVAVVLEELFGDDAI